MYELIRRLNANSNLNSDPRLVLRYGQKKWKTIWIVLSWKRHDKDDIADANYYAQEISRKTQVVQEFFRELENGNLVFQYEQGLQQQNSQEDTMLDELTRLLQANHNLILTGAPGTGKTYLAKEIAESLTKSTSKAEPREVLRKAIQEFLPSEELRKKRKELLDTFQNQFPTNTLDQITLEQYCSGQGQGTFCWWMEWGLKSLGKFFAGGASNFLVYFDKEQSIYIPNKNAVKEISSAEKWGDNISTNSSDIILKLFLQSIKKYVTEQQLPSANEWPKRQMSFLLKILNSYYPNLFFPINSQNHLLHIIDLFDLKDESGKIPGNLNEMNSAVIRFYKEMQGDADIDEFEFSDLLYQHFNIKDGEVKENGVVRLDGKTEFVQFHPSYDYTDFVEGLRPVQQGNEQIGFELKPGIFMKFCDDARKNPNKTFVFIIDEINRGEISKIFGELFFSIDPGYRGESGAVTTQYANLHADATNYAFNEEFYVPKNVYLIGTMNDIDRSVESFDFAMRRRFVWKEILANENLGMLSKFGNILKDQAERKLKALNNAIWKEKMEDDIGLSSGYHIGASYFLKLENYIDPAETDDGKINAAFGNLWDYHIEPLLKEYLRGRQQSEIDDLLKQESDGCPRGKLWVAYNS
jgi:5-methylcytosine-specific restriction protein B